METGKFTISSLAKAVELSHSTLLYYHHLGLGTSDSSQRAEVCVKC
jgi:hypothetical protein